MSEYVRTHKKHAILLAAVLTVCVGLAARYAVAEEPIEDTSTYNETTGRYDVTWGDDNTGRHILDTCPAGGGLSFFWTGDDGMSHTGYTGTVVDNSDGQNPVKLKFVVPNDPSITDWRQRITTVNGDSDVHAGNIKRSSPWAFHPLYDIIADYRIPDFAPTAEAGLTIYTAVNLDLYTTENAEGPLDGDWSVGDTLADLNLSITEGTINGVDGIYFATCEFEFDPMSTTGWVPKDGPGGWLDSNAFRAAHGGAIRIVGEHAQQAGS